MSHRNGAIIAFFGTLMGCAALWADTPLERMDDPVPMSSVLLFRSGRVVEGQITETETHYVVGRPIGKVEVAKTDIELMAKDLEEVYRYKLGRINDRFKRYIRLVIKCRCRSA